MIKNDGNADCRISQVRLFTLKKTTYPFLSKKIFVLTIENGEELDLGRGTTGRQKLELFMNLGQAFLVTVSKKAQLLEFQGNAVTENA